MFSKSITSRIILIVTLLFCSSFFANAALTPVNDLRQVSILINAKNDCSGYFGSGFSQCEITHVPSTNSPVFAEIMGKFDEDGSTETTASSQASDWNFYGNTQQNPGNNGTGTWYYTGANYPGISFWVAKASKKFVLNWMVIDNEENRDTCGPSKEFSIDCLSLAVSVKTGDWTTPVNTNGKNRSPKELSHISFYGKNCDSQPCERQVTDIPEPTSIALFSLALLGIAAHRKKCTV